MTRANAIGYESSWLRTLVGGRIAALIAGAIAFGQISLAEAASVVPVPACDKAGQSLNVNLSTAQSAGVDPYWSVTPGSGPTKTFLSGAWTALPSNWIQPSSSAAPTPFLPATYVYTLRFTLPCKPDQYKPLNITGSYAADNVVTAFNVNGPLWSGPTCGSACFTTATPFTVPPSAFTAGLNTISITVQNTDPAGQMTASGLAVDARLTGTCIGQCVECPKGYPNEWPSKELGNTYCCKGKPGGDEEFCCVRKKVKG